MDAPISVEEAILRVICNTKALPCTHFPLTTVLLGKTLAQDLVAKESFPPFPASIMDGYAVVAPIEPGIFNIVDVVHAGAISQKVLCKGEVAYITTGAMLPEGATGVIKIEDTEKIDSDSVNLKTSVPVGLNVRQVGSDIAAGETILRKGQVIGPSELGLIATTGFSQILCFNSPVIGVMSTGNELVDACETPTGSQVRDSNRLSLIASCMSDGQTVVDLGIVSDSKEELRKALLDASTKCDIVISSGGVSMGAADFVKPLLKEIGTVHFAKLNMKPGKPTTFATYETSALESKSSEHDSNTKTRRTLFFGLPGNPVSCLVTKALFVDTAVKRLQGRDSEACLHPQLTVQLAGESGSITLDPERPEYHRAILSNNGSSSSGDNNNSSNNNGDNIVYAYSTGNQRSSRLLSMRSANALLFLPQGPGTIPVGSQLQALLIGPLLAASRTQSVHPSAAMLDYSVNTAMNQISNSVNTCSEGNSDENITSSINSITTQAVVAAAESSYESFPRSTTSNDDLTTTVATATTLSPHATSCSTAKISCGSSDNSWKTIRVGLLTISDRASKGIYPDDSGPEMARLLKEMSNSNVNSSNNSNAATTTANSSNYPLIYHVVQTAIVPDEPDAIRGMIQLWCDPTTAPVDLLLTSGGTGFGLRDLTPETIKPLLHREAPGVAQALLNEGLKHTPLAVLSRPVVGTRYSTFICTLPGSVKAVKENIVCLKPLLPRIFELLKCPGV